jgi:hypothetical protein
MGPLSGVQLWIGLGKLFAVTFTPITLGWLFLHLDLVGRWCGALLRRLHLRRPEPEPEPVRIPLEKITADLCRLATAIRYVPRGASRARHAGLLRAYDEVLGCAALALDVPHALDDLPLGLDRDLERLRVEAALREAGLVFGPRNRQDTP